MRITEVKVIPVNEEKLKAYVSLTIDDCFVIRDIKIIAGNSGLFVAMPSKRRKDGQYKDIAHPLNQETRSLIEDQVFEAYQKEVTAMGQSLAGFHRSQSRNGDPDDGPLGDDGHGGGDGDNHGRRFG